jgi:hypothetical protein
MHIFHIDKIYKIKLRTCIFLKNNIETMRVNYYINPL